MGIQTIDAETAHGRWQGNHPQRAFEEREFREHSQLVDRWRKHDAHGTPETLIKAASSSQGSLARMFMAGHMSIDQLAWAEEIRRVADIIGRDVAIGTISLETRVDNGFTGHRMAEERRGRVRAEVAYTRWRGQLRKPAPVLAMIIEDRGIRCVGRAFRMRDITARALLLRALDAWPDCYGWARDRVDEEDLAAFYNRLNGTFSGV
jgi:hypothetical protein